MCKVAQGQVVQEEAEAECSLRNADVVDDTVSCSPPPSPLDNVVVDSDHFPRSAFVHTHGPSTRLRMQTWRDGGDERRRRRWKKDKDASHSSDSTLLWVRIVSSLFSWCL